MKIDLSKISALAKSGHNTCRGTGIVGRQVATNHLIICHCVWKALKGKPVGYWPWRLPLFCDLKPCIRCEGKGTVTIEVIGPDPREHTIAGMSKCHGCGGTGKVPAMQRDDLIEAPVTEPEAVH